MQVYCEYLGMTTLTTPDLDLWSELQKLNKQMWADMGQPQLRRYSVCLLMRRLMVWTLSPMGVLSSCRTSIRHVLILRDGKIIAYCHFGDWVRIHVRIFSVEGKMLSQCERCVNVFKYSLKNLFTGERGCCWDVFSAGKKYSLDNYDVPGTTTAATTTTTLQLQNIGHEYVTSNECSISAVCVNRLLLANKWR